MIIGLVALLMSLFGGVSPEAIKESVASIVRDAQRVEAIEVILDEAQETVDGYSEQLDDITDRIVELHADHGATRAQYHAVLEQAHDAMVDARTKLLDLRFEMKARMTQEEWEAVFPAPE